MLDRQGEVFGLLGELTECGPIPDRKAVVATAIESRAIETFKSLEDPEYRREYVNEHINVGLAFQIRQLRESKKWTQEELAKRTGKAQETISEWENPDYGRYSLSTLKKLAAAFDVALSVKFVSFRELVYWTVCLTQERLAPPSYDNDRLVQGINYGFLAARISIIDIVASTPNPYNINIRPIVAVGSEQALGSTVYDVNVVTTAAPSQTR
jgi:transcriptional regulator with XRE-family HTH domain